MKSIPYGDYDRFLFHTLSGEERSELVELRAERKAQYMGAFHDDHIVVACTLLKELEYIDSILDA